MKQLLSGLSVLVIYAMLLACGYDLTSEDHLARARIFVEQSDSTLAIAELKSALNKDVNNSRASALLGKLYFEVGSYEDADKELSRALSTGADATDVVPMLAKVLLSLGEFDRLDALALNGLDPESRSVVQAAKGLSMIYRANPVVAAEILEVALQNVPRSPYAEVAAARLSMEHAEFDEARGQLNEIIARFPEYAPAWNLLGDIESAQRRPKEAELAYSKVIEFSGDNFNALLNRALMSIYLNDFRGAGASLGAAVAGYPLARDHPGVQFITGLVQLNNKQLDAARKSFFQASEYSDNFPQTQYYLATIALEQGLVAQAMSNAYKFLGLVPDSVAGAKLAAKIELGQKSYKKAEKLLLPVVAARPDDVEALNLLASAIQAQGRDGEAVDLLAKVVALHPDSIEAGARLGASLLEAGSTEYGMQILRDVLEKYPGYEQADVLIVLNYLQQAKPGGAIQAARQYQERNPGSATPYYLLGRAHLALGERQEAITAFSKAQELRPGDPGAGSSLADLALSEGDFEAGRKYYRQVLEHYPDNMQMRLKIAASYAVEGKEQEMLESLQSSLSANPRAMDARLVNARYHMAKGQLEEVMPLLDQLTEEQREDPDALLTVAALELAVSRHNQALVTLEKLLKIRPDVGQYHYMKANAYAGLGDAKNLSAALERTLELDPHHFYARIALARMAQQSNRLDTFETQLKELVTIAADNLDVIRLQIVSAQRVGDNKSALQLLETVFSREPTSRNVIALAAQHQSNGNVSIAIEQLQRWVSDNPGDVKAREKLAEMYSRNNQLPDAIYQYREILELDPEHVMALNNLAWHLREDDPRRALELAGRAYRVAPDSGSILDTLAMVQLKNAQLIEARRSIDRALILAPENPEIIFHEAQLRVAEGDTKGAIKALYSLLAQHASFSGRTEAESLLKKLN